MEPSGSAQLCCLLAVRGTQSCFCARSKGFTTSSLRGLAALQEGEKLQRAALAFLFHSPIPCYPHYAGSWCGAQPR